MKQAIIKKVSLSLAFLQLFSNSLSLNKNKDIKPKSNLTNYVLVDNTNTPIYHKVNNETGDKSVISIFDDDNIQSHQYGASQRVFKTRFEELIKEPAIWEEMQKYYPVENFECLDDAMFFYEKYFYIIYDCGCGYAAGANFVFKLYEGREEEFLKDFGYPMYTYKDGRLDFNYETFMLKFFNFYNLEMREDYESIDKWILKDLYQHQTFRIAADNDYRKGFSRKVKDMTDEEYDELKRLELEHEIKLKEVSQKYRDTKKERVNLGIPLDANYGYLYIYLAKCGIALDAHYNGGIFDFEENDIISCDTMKLYKVDKDGEIIENVDCNDWHYVYVTDANDDQIIVSSWGNKYIFDNQNSNYTTYVKLKAH